VNQTAPGSVNRGQIAPLLQKPVIVHVITASRSTSRRQLTTPTLKRGVQMARRAMLWGLTLVVLAHLVMAVALETVLPQLRDPEYGYRLVRVREKQRHHPDRPLVLVLGTSRTQNAIMPTAMAFPDEPGSPLVFNFGQAGANPLDQRLILRRLFADGVRPAAVLVEICPPTLASGDDDQLTSHINRLTIGDLRALDPSVDSFDLSRRWAVSRMNGWYTQRLVIISHLAPGLLPWQHRLTFQWKNTDRFGFSPYPANKVDEFRAARCERVFTTHGPALRDLQVNELAVQSYRELITECREHGTPVAFFLTPESPTYRNWYSSKTQAALSVYLRQLTTDSGCQVFTSPTDFAESDFADGEHMLPSAATRYSRWLAETHLKRWLADCR